jgi:hypothetical protein
MVQPALSYDVSSLPQVLAAQFGKLPQVEAVAWAGSRPAQAADATSDFDVYVYARQDIPVPARAEIAHIFAERVELDNQFWEPGDEWIDVKTGLGVDIMYRTPQWIEEQLERALVKHQAAVGYSTCFWYNVVVSQPLFDRTGWFERLKQRADQPYPEPLRQAIVAKNHPILRRTISAYTHQLEKAVARRDLVSVNHRTAALLASYFDILFAVNRLPHPGEKRLVEFARKHCALLPDEFEPSLDAALRATVATDSLLQTVNDLIDGLDKLLRAEELL